MARTKTAPEAEDIDETAEAEDIDETAEAEDDDESPEAENGKHRKGREKMPFGRSFGVTVKFHDNLTDEDRSAIVAGILSNVQTVAESLDSKRSTRGEENPNLQTWLVAPSEYDWPESTKVERGIRIPAGKMADIIKKFAAANNVSTDRALEMLFEASSGDDSDE